MRGPTTKRRNLFGMLTGLLTGSALVGTARAQEADEFPEPWITTETGRNGKTIRKVVIDVAVLGHTNYDNEYAAHNRHPDYANRVEDVEAFRAGYRQSDLRGSSYYHEGVVYPGFTIPEPTEPRQVVWEFSQEPIGTFFDRGWAVINYKEDGPYVPRPDPHLLSHTDYFLGGVVSREDPTPTDMIATVGLQHTNYPASFLRAIVGGTGRFSGARGQMIQDQLGNNSSVLQGNFVPPGVEVPSPNFRVTFELEI